MHGLDVGKELAISALLCGIFVAMACRDVAWDVLRCAFGRRCTRYGVKEIALLRPLVPWLIGGKGIAIRLQKNVPNLDKGILQPFGRARS